MDPDYAKLGGSLLAETINAISLRVCNTITQTGPIANFGATEAILVDQTVTDTMNRLRHFVTTTTTGALPGDATLALQKSRKEEWDKFTEGEKDESEAKPNWPYPCKRCGKRTIYHWAVQLRSADEPSTDFYKCLNPHCAMVSKGS